MCSGICIKASTLNFGVHSMFTGLPAKDLINQQHIMLRGLDVAHNQYSPSLSCSAVFAEIADSANGV